MILAQNFQMVSKILNKIISQIMLKIKIINKMKLLVISIFCNRRINKIKKINNLFNKKVEDDKLKYLIILINYSFHYRN